jgi:GH24 family phage-related lysozyme (muramidase)
MSDYLEQSLAKLEQFEGCIPWMYRDTVGKVTVAVGLMLPDAAAAEKLPFQIDSRPATPAEIAAEFARVDALPMGRPAQFYRQPHAEAALELAKPEIDTLLRTVVLGFEQDLRTRLTGYDSYPDAVKMALLDMVYNLGPAKLFGEFPRLIKAVEAGAWAQAADCCSRRGPSAARNAWTRMQFLSLGGVVAKVQATASAGLLKDFGYGVIGMAAHAGGALRRWFKTPR